MVDVVELVVNVLRAAGQTNTWAELPADAARPALLVAEAGGPQTHSSSVGPGYQTKQDIQIDGWGMTKDEAREEVVDARTTLLRLPRHDPVHPEGIVTNVTATHLSWLPDEDWPVEGRPGPRYLIVVSVTAHD